MRTSIMAFLLLPALAVASGEPPVPDSPAVEVEYATYKLGDGDVIQVQVFGEPNFSGVVTIEPGGRGSFPYVGDLKVGGLTVHQASLVVSDTLSAEYLVDPHVSVWVTTYGSQPVRVLGAVKSPGVYFLRKPTHLTEILAEAGGVLEQEHVSEVQIRSGGGEQQVLPLQSVLELGETDPLIARGDVVYLPPGQVVYLSGQVVKPGAVSMEKGLTALQALTRAGGPTNAARLRGAYILREGEKMSLNLRRIMRGRESDIELKPGDQLFLRESTF